MKIKSLEDQTLVSLGGEALFTLPVTAQEFQRHLLVRIINDPDALFKAVNQIIAGRKGKVWSWTAIDTGHSFIRGVKGSRQIMHETEYGMLPSFVVPVYPIKPPLTSEQYIARMLSVQMGVIA
ncbi:MAG: hypothetical protein ACRC6V_06655 [Bacteroidales bacterium]